MGCFYRMDPSAIQFLMSNDILRKKEGILCYHYRDLSIPNLLRNSGLAVKDAPLKTDSSNTPSALYEWVLVEENGENANSNTNHGAILQSALRHVKPGGRLLVYYSREDLFDAIDSEDLHSLLTTSLPKEDVASTNLIGHSSDAIFCVVKSGAYKPKLPIHFVDDPSVFSKLCTQLLSEKYLGFDVETTLNEPRILCTAQLATEATVYVLDVLPVKDLRPLKTLMENKGVLKIIHNAAFEADVLRQYGISIYPVYDTLVESRRRYAHQKDLRHRLGDVCERELGIYLDKSWQASVWTRRPLTQAQIEYAAADAEVMLPLYKKFSAS